MFFCTFVRKLNFPQKSQCRFISNAFALGIWNQCKCTLVLVTLHVKDYCEVNKIITDYLILFQNNQELNLLSYTIILIHLFLILRVEVFVLIIIA